MPDVYAIYKYNFKVSKEKSAFPLQTGQSVFDAAQQLFSDVIINPVELPGEAIGAKAGTKLYIDIFCRRGDITVLVVCNEKSHRYLERLDEMQLVSHPGCFVIVDNRPGYAQMAIQRSSSFYGSVNKIVSLLQEAWGKKMFYDYELELQIIPQIRPGTFWEVIGEHTRQHHRVSRVSFHFPNPHRVGPIKGTEEMKKKMEDMTILIGALNAAKGTLTVQSDKKNQIRLERTMKDVEQVVALCEANSGIYGISVHFQNGIVYRFGEESQFFMNLEQSIIENFKRGQTVLGLPDGVDNALTNWLNMVWETQDTFCKDADTIPAPKRRKRSDSSSVRR